MEKVSVEPADVKKTERPLTCGEASVVGSEGCREDPDGTEGEARGSCTDSTGDGGHGPRTKD